MTPLGHRARLAAPLDQTAYQATLLYTEPSQQAHPTTESRQKHSSNLRAQAVPHPTRDPNSKSYLPMDATS